MQFMGSALTNLLSFIVAISVLVAIHEFGHYIVGRWAGMKVLRFSIGFGKPIWSRRAGKDDTEYCIASIPLGGYVRFLDSREGPIAPEKRAGLSIIARSRNALPSWPPVRCSISCSRLSLTGRCSCRASWS